MSEAATTPEELANKLTSLEGPDLEHLLALQESWGILADLSFSDLLLCAPMRLEPGDAPLDGSFVVLGQMRPTTSQTLLRDDLVGGVIRQSDPSLLGRAFSSGELVDGESLSQGGSEPVRLQCIPVRRSGRVIAVLVRESPLAVGRRPGLLERTYASLFGRFAQMITDGLFPYSLGGQPYVLEETVDDLPRVGDGVMLLDEHGRIEFTSPNAVNALHRLGVRASLAGIRLHELGVDERAVDEAYAHGLPTVEEVERSVGAVVLLRCLPLLAAGGVDGVLVLCRDVTDLRRRDRLLVSKDATIREIHHRVKNNLQTVSSLLRLQARRAGEHEGRQALTEAERRIRSIAVVHDFLSRDVKDQVSFSEIVVALIQLAEESVLPGRRVSFALQGDSGEVPAGLATPLAVVVSELLQNALEHAFVDGSEGTVVVELTRQEGNLVVRVKDDGAGLTPGFDIDSTGSLGLIIVRDLVEGQMGGRLEMLSGEADPHGLEVSLTIPI